MEVAKLQIWNLLVHKKDYEIEDHEKQTFFFLMNVKLYSSKNCVTFCASVFIYVLIRL